MHTVCVMKGGLMFMQCVCVCGGGIKDSHLVSMHGCYYGEGRTHAHAP